VRHFVKDRQPFRAKELNWLLLEGQTIDDGIRKNGAWEPLSTAVVEAEVREGFTVLDIGANIGWYTALMSKLVGPNGRVIAFEAMEDACIVTASHIELNNCTNAELLQNTALGDVNKNAEAFFNYSWGRGEFEVTQRKNMVHFRKLDTIAASLNLTRLDFVKIDVDGWELKIMQGAEKTFRRYLPTILLEVCDYALHRPLGRIPEDYIRGTQAAALLDFTQSLGYALLREKDRSEVTSIPQLLSEFNLVSSSINVLCVPRKR